MTPVLPPLEHRQLALHTTGLDGPLDLHVVLAGPPDGAPVLLLHGFPDLWWGWRQQIGALADAGYRVIVPDQRGYGRTAKPVGVRAYGMDHLMADMLALLDALGHGSAHVVGHDWGGGVAWSLAARHPERVRTLTVANCPRPRVLARALYTNLRQLRRSWYMFFFQLPWLPQRALANGGALRALLAISPKGTFTEADLAIYREAATEPAMRAAVSWYRAALRDPGPSERVRVPTLLLWGDADPALGRELASASLADVDDSRLVWLPGVGHFSPHEAPGLVNPELLAHLGDHGGPDPWIYKIVPRAVWEAADDPWAGSEHDLRDGFIHLSARHQVEGTLAAHFAGQDGLVVLRVDPDRLGSGVLRWEPSRAGARFPHVYGGLAKEAVVGVEGV